MDVVYEAEDVKPGAMPPRSPYLKSLHGDSHWNVTNHSGTEPRSGTLVLKRMPGYRRAA
jgi:hypothetical protein